MGSIAQHTKSAREETIAECHTHMRLMLTTPPSEITAYIHNLGK